MGGTFDPVHHGHLVAASEVQSWFGLDEVVFVPTGAPWQKAERQVTEAEHRYLMTGIATASNPRLWSPRPRPGGGRAAGCRSRTPLPDDGDRHRIQPALLGLPGRHRPGGPDV